MNEFKNRMNKYMDEDRQIMNRQQQIENEMFVSTVVYVVLYLGVNWQTCMDVNREVYR